MLPSTNSMAAEPRAEMAVPALERRPSARRFVILALGLAGAVVGAIALFNYLVDPYGMFGRNTLGIYISAERECKPRMVQGYPHNALLVGNSRIAMTPTKDLESFQFFNAGLGGGDAEEAYYFLYHYAHHEKLVVLGVELGQGDPIPMQGDIFGAPSLKTMLNQLLNLRTVEYSVHTIYGHFAGLPTFLRADGSFDPTDWFEHWDKVNPAHMAWAVGTLKQGMRGYPAYPPLPMTCYSRIAECLRERGITCVVVIPPIYGAAASFLRDPSVTAKYDGWRSRLHAIFSNVVDLSVSPYCAETNFFRDDPLHFKPDTCVRIMNNEVIPVAKRAMQMP